MVLFAVGVIATILYVACFSLIEAILGQLIGKDRAKTTMTTIMWLLILTLCIGFWIGLIHLCGWIGVAIFAVVALVVGAFVTMS